MKVKARAVNGPTDAFKHTEISRRDLDKHDVLIDIKYAGICHSDIHTARGEWGEVQYPLVPGHEIAGVVADIGDDVTSFKVGDRVGVGCMVDSCGKCTSCQEGEEQYCEEGNIPTYAGVDKYGDYTQGGYSTHIVVTEGFVVRIPDNIPFDAAAPLLCAGITTYSPLKRWQAGEGKKSSGNWSRWSWAFRSKDCTCNGCRSNRSFTNVKKARRWTSIWGKRILCNK